LAENRDDGFTDRALMSLVDDLVALEADMARMGVKIRALAKERGIKVPAPEEI
jgi:hypothetical protein